MSLKQAGFMSTSKVHQPLLSRHKKLTPDFSHLFLCFAFQEDCVCNSLLNT